MISLYSKKDVQRLNGCINTLGRFIVKSSDNVHSFLKALIGNDKLCLGQEQAEAFECLKDHLNSLPPLAGPHKGDTLYLYIIVSAHIVSVMLLREECKNKQLIYFISHTLFDNEKRYTLMEKSALAIIITTRKLKQYFDAHHIIVPTVILLEKALDNFEKLGRLAKWAMN